MTATLLNALRTAFATILQFFFFSLAAYADDLATKRFHRFLFTEAYVDAVEKNPYIYLGHSAFVYNSIENSLPKTPYTVQWAEVQHLYAANRYFEAIDKLFGSKAPIALALEVNAGPVSVSVEAKTVISALTRRFWNGNALTEDEVRERLDELVRDPVAVRAIAGIVYDGYFDEAKFVPYNQIDQVQTPFFVKPTDPPSAFLSALSVDLRTQLEMTLAEYDASSKDYYLGDWEGFRELFFEAVAGRSRDTFDAEEGALADVLETEPNGSAREVAFSLLGSLELSDDFVDLFNSTRPLDEFASKEEQHASLKQEFDTVRIGLGGLEQIASVSDPGTARALRVASGVISAYYYVQLAQTATTTLSTMAYGVGAVGAIAGVFSALGSNGDEGPDPLLLQIQLQQHEIIDRLSAIDQRLQLLASSVASIEREIKLLGLSQGKQFEILGAQIESLRRTALQNYVIQMDSIGTLIEQDIVQAVRQFEVEVRTVGAIDWKSDDALRRVAILESFALDTVSKSPFVAPRQSAEGFPWQDMAGQPWNWSRAVVSFTREGIDFYGVDPLLSLFDDAMDREAITGALDELGSLTAESTFTDYNHEAFAAAMAKLAFVGAMADGEPDVGLFNVEQLSAVQGLREDHIRALIALLPLRLALLKADLRNLQNDWNTEFFDAFEAALGTTDLRAPGSRLDPQALAEEILNSGFSTFGSAFDCLRGAGPWNCKQELGAVWLPTPITNFDRAEAIPLLAAGIVDGSIDEAIYLAADTADVTGFSISPRNDTVMVCVPVVLHMNWSASVISTYQIPYAPVATYGFPLSLQQSCFDRPRPPWFGDRLRALYQINDQIVWQRAMRQLASELWLNGLPRDLIELPEFGGFTELRLASSSFAAQTLREETERIQNEIEYALTHSNSKTADAITQIDGQLIGLVSQLRLMSPTCREALLDRFVKPLLPTQSLVAGRSPSEWYVNAVRNHQYSAIKTYAHELAGIDYAGLENFADCYAPSEAILYARQWLEFLEGSVQ